ncbi:MAG: endonuclease [Bacteroidetes bacterium HGW-Bacteroidetes-11]|nr:MAG: endonuclease [Bacteroidetes bacterium HGW-Bacteroidetes-11]
MAVRLLSSVFPVLLFLFIAGSHQSIAQNKESKPEEFRIMFYNVENLFDPFDDTLKNDAEFLPGGMRGWTWKKFEKKLQNTSKVIISTGGWRPPEIVGFCEVENRFSLIQLLKRTPLERFGYQIVHEESNDFRGIDVALIYRPDKFKKLYHRAIPVIFEGDTAATTRDILYVKGLAGTDTLHVFINHWPSKYGGASATIPRRRDAALALRRVVDSLNAVVTHPLIVITGDFNDTPEDESVLTHLGAQLKEPATEGPFLFNLMGPFLGKWDTGTHKFREEWSIIDQFIVSSALLRKTEGLKLSDKKAEIVRFPFLIEEDRTHNGTKPYRTYNGMRYQGGFSDHLPILLHLEY